jgi:hypothetical protein
MSGCKIPKFSPLCPDYIRHGPVLPKFVRTVHQASKIVKNHPDYSIGLKKKSYGCWETAYRPVRNHLCSEAWCTVAYGYTGLYLLISRAFIPIDAFPLTEIFCSLFVQSESTSVYTQNKKQSEDAANMMMSTAEGRIELINGNQAKKRKLRARIELQSDRNSTSCDVNQ